MCVCEWGGVFIDFSLLVWIIDAWELIMGDSMCVTDTHHLLTHTNTMPSSSNTHIHMHTHSGIINIWHRWPFWTHALPSRPCGPNQGVHTCWSHVQSQLIQQPLISKYVFKGLIPNVFLSVDAAAKTPHKYKSCPFRKNVYRLVSCEYGGLFWQRAERLQMSLLSYISWKEGFWKRRRDSYSQINQTKMFLIV